MENNINKEAVEVVIKGLFTIAKDGTKKNEEISNEISSSACELINAISNTDGEDNTAIIEIIMSSLSTIAKENRENDKELSNRVSSLAFDLMRAIEDEEEYDDNEDDEDDNEDDENEEYEADETVSPLDKLFEEARSITNEKLIEVVTTETKDFTGKTDKETLTNIKQFQNKIINEVEKWMTDKNATTPFLVGGFGHNLDKIGTITATFSLDTDAKALTVTTSLNNDEGKKVVSLIGFDRVEEIEYIGENNLLFKIIINELTKAEEAISNSIKTKVVAPLPTESFVKANVNKDNRSKEIISEVEEVEEETHTAEEWNQILDAEESRKMTREEFLNLK